MVAPEGMSPGSCFWTSTRKPCVIEAVRTPCISVLWFLATPGKWHLWALIECRKMTVPASELSVWRGEETARERDSRAAWGSDDGSGIAVGAAWEGRPQVHAACGVWGSPRGALREGKGTIRAGLFE